MRVAETTTERHAIFEHRLAAYLATSPHLISHDPWLHAGEDRSDARSYLFYLEAENQLVASMRYTWSAADWFPQLGASSQRAMRELVASVMDSQACPGPLEISRLLVAQRSRSGATLDRILNGSARWLAANTQHTQYIAICAARHVPLYEYYGSMRVGSLPVVRSDGSTGVYHLVKGDLLALATASRADGARSQRIKKDSGSMKTFFSELDALVVEKWRAIHSRPFWIHLRKHGLDRELYTLLMREIYHYTRHNAQNQALAAITTFSSELHVLKFALHHAYSEAGHDQMVIADLEHVGVARTSIENTEPLPETQAFIAYLYRVAQTRGAIARLGYSYWAESCYSHIEDLTRSMKKDLGLGDHQMTFFAEHSVIDDGHFRQIKKVIMELEPDEATQMAIKSVLAASLRLQGTVLDAVYDAYCQIPERRVA